MALNARRTAFWSVIAAVPLVAMIGSWWMLHGADSQEMTVQRCTKAANKVLCLTDAIDADLKDRGISAAFDLLAASYDADPEFSKACHSNAHEIGKAAYAQFHATGKVELSSKTMYCG